MSERKVFVSNSMWFSSTFTTHPHYSRADIFIYLIQELMLWSSAAVGAHSRAGCSSGCSGAPATMRSHSVLRARFSRHEERFCIQCVVDDRVR